MSSIALQFFGAPHVERDGAPVHVTRRKAIALLAYLAVTEQAHDRDVLAALFWPELSQRRARANLRHLLYALNKALGPGWIERAGSELSLSQKAGLQVDVTKFRRLLAAPVAHKHSFPHLCDACIQALTAAANLYRGDFLAGLSLSDSPEFEAWQLLEREVLQRQLFSTLDQLAQVYAEAGRRQYDLAIAYARRRLALDPLHEPAHRTLIRLYAESGDRAAALRQYEECGRLLGDELDMEPEPETTELVDQIRQGLAAVEGKESLSIEAPAHNLPVQPTLFIGRARELQQIAAHLAEPDCRLLTIVGPGGSGKTRLAIQAAAGHASGYRDGVHFVDLAPVESPGLLAAAILRSLDAPEAGAVDPQRRLCDYLRPRQALLVLDNLEHLLEAVDLLPQLLHTAPDLKLLVTSRERLNVQEEWLLPLDGLSVPPGTERGLPAEAPESRADLEAYDASLLFLDRMRRIRPNFAGEPTALSDADAAAIAGLCRLLEGMPLAIELAAGWTRTLSLGELQREILESLKVLRTTLRDVPPRLRSMHAAFDHSWRLLSSREKQVMCQMSVFRSGCTREAAQQVTGATVDDLAGLVDKSWLRLREGGRYTVHELARQYCEEKLADLADEAVDVTSSGDAAGLAVRLRHCAYYGSLISDLIGSTNYRPATLGDILVEFGNLRAALRCAVDNHQLEAGDNICWSIFFVGDMMGWLHFSIQTLETVVPALEEQIADPELGEQERTEIAHVLGVTLQARFSQYGQLGMLNAARACNRRLVALTEMMEPGRIHTFWHALACSQSARLAINGGDYAVAHRRGLDTLALFEAPDFESLVYGTERGGAFWQAEVLELLGLATLALGEYEMSEDYHDRGLAIRDSSGEQRFKGMNLGAYAELARITGDLVRAQELAREGLRLSTVYGDRIGIAFGHLAVGTQLVAQDRLEPARPHLYKSLEMGRHSGRLDIVMDSLCQLGRSELVEGRSAGASRYLEDALAAFEQADVEHHNALAGVWLGLGWCALAEENITQARRLFEKACAQRGAKAFEIQESQAGLADVLLREGESEQAAALLKQIIDHPATAHRTRALAQQQLARVPVQSESQTG